MANNRMFLVCPECRKYVCLGKNLADGWYSPPGSNAMQDFFDEHIACGVKEEAFEFADELDDIHYFDFVNKKILLLERVKSKLV